MIGVLWMLFVILMPESHLPGIYLISPRELTLKKKKLDLKLGKVEWNLAIYYCHKSN